MVPSTAQIDAIPLARAGEFELNKQGNRRFRTQREGDLLLVWIIK